MTTSHKKRLLLSGALMVTAFSATSGFAAPAKTKAPAKQSAASNKARPETRVATLPETRTAGTTGDAFGNERYLTLAQLKTIQKSMGKKTLPVLQPTWEGLALKRPMRDLLTEPSFDGGSALPPAAPGKSTLLAQAGPRPRPRTALPPVPAAVPSGAAAPRPAAVPATPRWVRYPLEFQLCGIGLGTKAVDKDRFNRIDRYGLFALHGNPTAVVVPSSQGFGINVNQQPPEVPALFPTNQGGGLPDWASAITVTLDNNHVQWLYRRDTYSMGFVVDRLGFVDAIVVAGIQSNIATTQLEDPVHSVRLGDDLRKVLFRYGYPDTIETYTVGVAGAAPGVDAGAVAGGNAAGAVGAEGGAAGGAGGAAAGGAAGGEGGGAAGAGAAGNTAFRTFEIRYEQSYNVVFTIRNNRVVRIYIFGDPDFFNDRRRQNIRTGF